MFILKIFFVVVELIEVRIISAEFIIRELEYNIIILPDNSSHVNQHLSPFSFPFFFEIHYLSIVSVVDQQHKLILLDYIVII